MIIFFVTVGRALFALFNGLRDPEYRALIITVFLILAGGTIFYHRVEQWSWLDSIYFSVVALLTVGFGDLVPTTSFSRAFTIAYLLMGVGVIATFVQLMIKKKEEKRSSKSESRREQKNPEGDNEH